MMDYPGYWNMLYGRDVILLPFYNDIYNHMISEFFDFYEKLLAISFSMDVLVRVNLLFRIGAL